MNYWKRVLISAVIALGAVSALEASEHHGIVTFHGLPLPGVVVTATQGDRKVVTSTDEDGTYSLADLADGTWTIEVEISGFDRVSREIGVAPGAPTASWDLKLAAPELAPVPATAAASSRPPADGRGATGGPAAAAAGGRGAPAMTPAQAQAAAKARTLAQLQAQDKAQARSAALAASTAGSGGSGDSVIMSGSLGSGGGGGGGASFGNSVGGSQYNGNASFSLDNSVWDATSYSLSGIHTPKPAFAKGRINTSFGGPLKIPHLLKGKAGTFVLSYSMGRTRNGVTSNATVPTALERSGVFSPSVVLYDPRNGAPFPGGNQIPASRLDSAALALAKYFPSPNSTGSRLNYQAAIVSVSNQDNFSARLNQTLGKNDRLSGTIGWQRSSGVNPNIFSFIDDSANNGVNTSITWTHTFSKKLIQNLTYNFSRSRTQSSPFFANRENIAAELGILGTSSLPLNWGPPGLNFTNYTGLYDGSASLSRNQTSGVSYSINLMRTKHQWSIGGDYRRQQINPLSDSNGRGSFTFTGLATTGPNGDGGYDFADFLLSRPDVASINFGNADKYFRTWKIDAFVNDNWSISKGLTATLGLRYDYTAPYVERYDRMANLDIGPGFSTAATVLAGRLRPRSVIKSDFNTVSPNLGLAWMLFPKNPKMPTSLRFGFSQTHQPDFYGSVANNLAGQPPFSRVLSIAGSSANPLSMQTAFLNTPAFNSTYAVDPNYKLLSVTQAMLIAIQPLPKGYYTVAGFVYVKASNLDQSFLPNSLPPGLTAPAVGPPSGYIYTQPTGKARGTVQVFQLGRNMASGFSASLSLQTSRVLDNSSISQTGAGSVAQNWRNLNAEWATTALVPKAQLGANWQYSTGQGKAGGTLLKGWRGVVFKDWTFTNAFTYRAGTPLTATVAGNRAVAGGTAITGTVRADATGLPIDAPAGSNQPFNLGAFAVPASGHWGNAGRNTIIGPAVWVLNGSLGRVFRLGERRSADIRFDANNFINHVVITSWSTVVNASNFGLPTGTQQMRTMTANLRFRF
jgi:hypothetical protein